MMLFLHVACVVAALVAPTVQLLAQTRPTGTVVVSNMNDNTAMIVDPTGGRVVATLPTGEGPHEVAVSHDGRWAVVSNYGVRGRPGSFRDETASRRSISREG